jgi:hypothetical protein
MTFGQRTFGGSSANDELGENKPPAVKGTNFTFLFRFIPTQNFKTRQTVEWAI